MKTEKAENFVTNMNDKEEHIIHIRNIKQALDHGLEKKKSVGSLNSKEKFG